MLKIKLHCQFADFSLEVDQSLPSNKIIGLFGASGSGKSRLIRQLIGFDRQYQNQVMIKFNDNCWQNTANRKFTAIQSRGIGYLPQTVDLFPHLSSLENILFSQKNRITSLTNSEIEDLLVQLDIAPLKSKMPNQLSGGQKQRVALARAIVAAEKILILDEPLSAVGENHKPRIMQLLKSLNLKKELTIIFSSHDRYDHAFLTDHLVTMENGKILQSGSYHDLATDINKGFAQVPDSINHLSAQVVNFDHEFSVNQLQINNHRLWAGNRELEVGAIVNLEIRARDISISTHPTEHSSILNSLKVKIVETKEISGHQYLLKLSFGNSFLIAFLTKKSFFDLNLHENLEVYAMFKAVSVLPIAITR